MVVLILFYYYLVFWRLQFGAAVLLLKRICEWDMQRYLSAVYSNNLCFLAQTDKGVWGLKKGNTDLHHTFVP